MRHFLFAALFAALPFAASASSASDSTWVYVHAAPGANGLHIAVQDFGGTWHALDRNRSFVVSEFGAWSYKGKRMDDLRVRREGTRFRATWTATESRAVCATVATPDLTHWHVQRFFNAPASNAKPCADARDTLLTVDGKPCQGTLLRLANTELRAITDFVREEHRRGALYAETCADDHERYAGIGIPQLRVSINTRERKAISDHLIGIFFEDLSHAADGGLYAELVQNRDFEYSAADQHRPAWGADYAWTSSRGQLTISKDAPLHANNAHHAVLAAGETITNTGFDGIVIKRGARYDFSAYVCVTGGGGFLAAVIAPDGKTLASCKLKAKAGTGWQQLRGTLTATADCDTARLAFTYVGIGGKKAAPSHAGKNACPPSYADMISLFPRDTYKGRANGLRRDLAETLAALHPRFVRFPGGCVAHGDGLDDAYDWKGSVGPLYARRPLRNLWGYHQTRGLGYFEYFQFCEDIGADALPVLAAGVSCQHSHTASHHTHDELTTRSQQGGVPMDEMTQYVQNFLDLVEFANGPTTTKWGKLRADMGHPAPFHLKYVGVGNEDMITEVFKERFKMIHDALRRAHPEITVVGTTGPSHEGSDYADGWEFARQERVPVVDEHYYERPGWFVNNRDFYDNYDRQGPHVYLGEYAAHLNGRPANVETALTEALYLTDIERNGDVVDMTSYAPLFAKEGHVNWRPDLIYFSNTAVHPTVGYYAQQLFGQGRGTEYATTTLNLQSANPDAAKRIGVSTVYNKDTREYIIKMVNLLPCPTAAHITLDGATVAPHTATATVLAGAPKDKDARPAAVTIAVGPAFDYQMPAYSLTVVRVKEATSKNSD